MADVEKVRRWIDEAERVVALTGAGISTDSGIPDFRGPQGLWTKNPLAEKMSNIHYYLADKEVRKLASRDVLAELTPVAHVEREQTGAGGRVGDRLDAETRERLERLRRGECERRCEEKPERRAKGREHRVGKGGRQACRRRCRSIFASGW